MTVYLNGKFVPEAEATVSVFDRGFLYGDGLFETVRLYAGKPFRWPQHLRRLRQGAAFVGITLAPTDDELTRVVAELVARNSLAECLLRIALSRGIGPRGYSPKGADSPTLAMSLHALPAQTTRALPAWKTVTSIYRVAAGDPVLMIKSAGKLLNVLARAEAEARGADEALLVNTNGHLTECAAGNLFWIEGGTVCTPPLEAGLLDGVTRGLVLEICRGLKIPVELKLAAPGALFTADGVILSNSAVEIVEVVELDGRPLRRSPLVARLGESYGLQVLAEC